MSVDGAAIPESAWRAVANADLEALGDHDRAAYYTAVCKSVGLNPLTRPLEYIELNGKLTLYAKRDATDQLRRKHHVSVEIVDRAVQEDVYIVRARAMMPDGRTDESLGAVSLAGLEGEGLANALMKAECVPLDSEILTRDGWKRHDQLRIGEFVLAYDCERDETVWTPVLNVTTYPSLPMVRMVSAGGQFDVRCTSNHSWPVRMAAYEPDQRGNRSRGPRGPYASRGRERKLVEAQQLNSGHRLILAAPERDTVGPLTPTEAAILGWAVTDGTVKRVGNSVRIGICQSKEEQFDEIRLHVQAVAPGTREIVSPARTRTFPSTGRTYETKAQHWWYLPSALSRDLLRRANFVDTSDLPRLATQLGGPARRAMLDAFMRAEADMRGTFYNGDQHLVDTFLILCACEGLATGRTVAHLTVTRTRLKKTRHVAVHFLAIAADGEATAWCPTTAYGTWVMRQTGRVMITGNTKAKRRVALSICGLGMLDETEIETVPGATLANGAVLPRVSSEPTTPPSAATIFRAWDASAPSSRAGLYAHVKQAYGKRVLGLSAVEVVEVLEWIDQRTAAASDAGGGDHGA